MGTATGEGQVAATAILTETSSKAPLLRNTVSDIIVIFIVEIFLQLLGENINVSAAFIHVVGDFIQSIGVFIAAIVIFFKPEWSLIDPICTFIFSFLVLATTLSILRKTLTVLLEATPSDINFELVKNTFLGVKGIHQVHNLRIWGLTTDKNALTAHLAIQEGFDAQKVLHEATRKIRGYYDFYEMTLQVETFVDEMQGCDSCKTPNK